MQGIYDHIDFYTEIVIDKNKYYLKKLKLGMYINFWVNYRAWKLTGNLSSLDEIIEECVYNSKKVNKKHKNVIADKIMERVSSVIVSGNDVSDNVQDNKNWLSELIAYFGFHCGWDKDKILDLYMDEVESILDSLKKLVQLSNDERQDRNFLSHFYAVSKPSKYEEEIINKREKFGVVNSDLEKLRKMNKEWMSKSYGGDNAVG